MTTDAGTITNCYYVNTQIGSPSNACTLSGYYQVFASEPTNRIYKQMTSSSQTYYAACNISGVKSKYFTTGSPIDVAYTVTGVDGNVLTKGKDYEAVFSPTTTVQVANDYTLTITAKEGSGYTGSQTFTFSVTDFEAITSSTTSWEDGGIYKVTSNVTINNRIIVNGNVTLILKDGFTLNANKGIELTAGNQLTIKGENENSGTLTCKADIHKSGIGAYRLGTLIINGGTINATGGSYGAGIGGDIYSLGGTITINGGQITANGGYNAPGIGPGNPFSNACYNPSGTVRLGWTNTTDFIQVTGNGADYGFGQRITDLGFVSGKGFTIDGTTNIATSSNIKGVYSIKLVPDADVLNLANNADNTAIASANSTTKNVVLAGRTLYKDGKWNTICLPFNVTLAGSPLAGADALTVTEASISEKTLNLTFGNAVTTLTAGTPYIIKWDSGDDLTETDLVFSNVTINSAPNNFSSGSGDTKVSFMGTYGVTNYDATDTSILLMGGGNTLYYPLSGASIGACRAYFKIGGAQQARQLTSFNIDFGGVTEIVSANDMSDIIPADTWYTLDGRRLSGKPTVSGIYINNGNKVAIK
ncbi:MAG: hypothetical protein IJP74_11980 [Prevotella sp.]|nr:hypothetical protein [Prevotella sp.]